MKKIVQGGKRVFALCFAAVCFFSLSLPAMAKIPDRPENLYVLDEANVLSPETEEYIVEKNKSLFQSTGAEIVVVAVEFADGKYMDDYSVELFDSWKIGSAERNNGLLLTMAVGENKFYALAGYGIESYFNGSRLDQMLSDDLEEDFDAQRYDQGVRAFFDDALSQMYAYYSGEEGEDPEEDGSELIDLIITLFVLALVVLVLVVVLRAIFSGFGGGGGYGGGGGGNGFWRGMLWGSLLSGRRRTMGWRVPPPGGFGIPRGPRGGGFGGGFTHGGRSGGFGGGGFSHGGGTGGGGAGRR